MKSFLVFLRILIVGCLWGIVFTEGIRVIMLCNWHFDIFWPDHWRQFGTMWKAGWAPHAAKEWAFIILIVTFIPMLITGWWTLSLVAWEDIIWNIIKFPYTLYQRFAGKTTTAAMPVNNRYGVVKRKSYKQIRPVGINTLRVPISDYGNTATSSPLATAPYAGAPAYSAPFAGTRAAAAAATTPVKKTTDVAATIDHALFKFDDDDDDFDLDIDSFEKTSINKKKPETENKVKKRVDFDDDEDDFEKTDSRRRKSFDDEDDEEDDIRAKSRDKDRDSKKSHHEDRESRRDDKETRNSKASRNNDSYDKPKKSHNAEDKTSAKSVSESSGTAHSPVYDALTQKNYDVITNVRVGDTVVDYVGVSESEIYLCMVDKEAGDWLADEEMFNGEEPLWFSESSHRVSPVCKLHNVYPKIKDALKEEGFEQDISALVVIQMANIINADDMFDIWNDLHIEVTRINRGAPKEIKLLSKRLPEAEGHVAKKDLDTLKKLLKNLK